jgi:hypothetical protein
MRKVREQDILYVMRLLEQSLPFDEPPKLTLRVNNNGRQCVRCEASTKRKRWMTDIYGKHFFYSVIPPGAPVTQDSVRGLLVYLQSNLLS